MQGDKNGGYMRSIKQSVRGRRLGGDISLNTKKKENKKQDKR
jgi:hypothetical protein